MIYFTKENNLSKNAIKLLIESLHENTKLKNLSLYGLNLF